MVKAREAILAAGGAEKINSFTRYYLALLGILSYRAVPGRSARSDPAAQVDALQYLRDVGLVADDPDSPLDPLGVQAVSETARGTRH